MLVAAQGTAPSSEVRALRDARVALDRAASGAQEGDWTTARSAFFDYTEAWNGIEQYVRVRSLQLYHDVEDPFSDLQKQLDSENPSDDAIAALQAQRDSFSQAIALAEAGPSLGPVADQVAEIRTLRLQLRATQRALQAGNVSTAQATYRKFEAGWDSVEDYIRDRSRDVYRDIESAMGDVNFALLRTGSPDVSQVSQVFDGLLSRYNQGLSLVAAELPVS